MEVLATSAVNCCVWPASRVIVAGLTLTAIEGASVMVADAITALFAWLVAVTVTVCCDATLAGAVYNPLEPIVPAPDDGLIDQFTAVLLVFKTVAENCWVWLAYKVAVAGPTDRIEQQEIDETLCCFLEVVAEGIQVCCLDGDARFELYVGRHFAVWKKSPASGFE